MPPPSPPSPINPGAALRPVVRAAFTLAGSVESFNETAFRRGLLDKFSGATAVDLTVRSASVRVDLELEMSSDAASTAAATALAPANAAVLSAELGVVITAMDEPVIATRLIEAPSPPPPTPPPPSPPPPPPPPSSPSAPVSLIPLIAAGAAGVLLLVCCAGWWLRRRSTRSMAGGVKVSVKDERVNDAARLSAGRPPESQAQTPTPAFPPVCAEPPRPEPPRPELALVGPPKAAGEPKPAVEAAAPIVLPTAATPIVAPAAEVHPWAPTSASATALAGSPSPSHDSRHPDGRAADSELAGGEPPAPAAGEPMSEARLTADLTAKLMAQFDSSDSEEEPYDYDADQADADALERGTKPESPGSNARWSCGLPPPSVAQDDDDAPAPPQQAPQPAPSADAPEHADTPVDAGSRISAANGACASSSLPAPASAQSLSGQTALSAQSLDERMSAVQPAGGTRVRAAREQPSAPANDFMSWIGSFGDQAPHPPPRRTSSPFVEPASFLGWLFGGAGASRSSTYESARRSRMTRASASRE